MTQIEKTPEEQLKNKRLLRQILENDVLWESEFARAERSVLRSRGFSDYEQENILKDTYLAAWKNLQADQYNGDSKPRYYLHKIARRHAADVIDGNIRRREMEEALASKYDMRDPEDEAVQAMMEGPMREGLDEIQRRIHLEVINDKHRIVLSFLLNIEKRRTCPDRVDMIIAKEAQQRGIDLPANQVYVNIQRAKPMGEQIINAVTDERELGERFRRATLNMLNLRSGKISNHDEDEHDNAE